MKKISIKLILLPILTLSLLHGAQIINLNTPRPPLEISKELTSVNFHSSLYHIFHFGHKRLITDMMWIWTLLESDIEHYQKKDFNSWMYLRFNNITNLDPKFLKAYQFGGCYLSVIKDDDLGAESIFEKGLKNFPYDAHLNYYGGMHAFLELDDSPLAVERLKKTKNSLLAPQNIDTLIARISAKGGDLDLAYDMIYSAYAKLPESDFMREKYFDFLYALKAEKDLGCLHVRDRGPTTTCDTVDFQGEPYRKLSNGKYEARRPWKLFRPSRSK